MRVLLQDNEELVPVRVEKLSGWRCIKILTARNGRKYVEVLTIDGKTYNREIYPPDDGAHYLKLIAIYPSQFTEEN